MVLDVKSTFDALVARYTPDAAARERILGNRFYRHVSAALAGSHEYMAMEKLLELSEDERWDLVVLDTPPTRHALDFLEAPDRLMDFLDTSVLRWFLRPYFVAGRLTLKVATRTGRPRPPDGRPLPRPAVPPGPLRVLPGLREHVRWLQGARERGCTRSCGSASSGFVLVAGPSPLALEEALYFHRRLDGEGNALRRVRREPRAPRPRPRGALRAAGGGPRWRPELAARLAETLREQQVLARVERRAVARLEVDTRERPLLVPELEQDVHDLRGLAEFGELVFGGPAARPRATAVAR